MRQQHRHMPAGEIFRSGMGLTCIYTGVGVVVMLLVSHVEWLAGVGAYVKRFLQWLFSLLPQSETTIVEEETREQVQENVNMLEQLGLEEGKSSIIWEVLERIVMICWSHCAGGAGCVGFLSAVLLPEREIQY